MTLTPGGQTRGPVAVIAFPAPGSVLTLRRRGEQALADNSRAIAIDLRAARHVDTQTLSELCTTLRSISRHGAQLSVVGADPRVRWALTLCEIDGLELHQTMKSALARTHTRQRRLNRPSREVLSWRPRAKRRGSTARS